MKIELRTPKGLFLVRTDEEKELIMYDLEDYLDEHYMIYEYDMYRMIDGGYSLKLDIYVEDIDEFKSIEDGLTDIIGICQIKYDSE